MIDECSDEALDAEVRVIGWALANPLELIPVEPRHIWDPLHREIIALLHEARVENRIMTPVDVAAALADHPDWIGLEPMKMLCEMFEARSVNIQVDALTVMVGCHGRGHRTQGRTIQ